jgi:hypothetical protein
MPKKAHRGDSDFVLNTHSIGSGGRFGWMASVVISADGSPYVGGMPGAATGVPALSATETEELATLTVN